MNVKYTGPCKDYSGYGEACRHDVAALLSVGVDVSTQVPRYSLEISDYGKIGQKVTPCENKVIEYKYKIIHTTPNVYKQFIEPDKYNIGRVFWETDKLPLDFAINCQLLDEIWTGSKYNAEAIRNAGVTKPIHIIPEAIDTDIDEYQPYIVANQQDFKFYSIFEWTERKNPQALLTAFWQEFKPEEKVSLTVKTYIDNFTPDKRADIMQLYKMVKKKARLDIYPATYMYRNLMDRHQLYRFHTTFDCFVSAHRGEGWGIPQVEAMLTGHAIISTNCGGVHEYLANKTNSLLIPYSMENVDNNRNQAWYTRDQKWASIDILELRNAMRWCYENQDQCRKIGELARALVVDKFSLRAVGQKMLDRLKDIDAGKVSTNYENT